MSEVSTSKNLLYTILVSDETHVYKTLKEETNDSLENAKKEIEKRIENCRDHFKIDKDGHIIATDEELDSQEEELDALSLSMEKIDYIINERIELNIALDTEFNKEKAIQILIRYYEEDCGESDRINNFLNKLSKANVKVLPSAIREKIIGEEDKIEKIQKKIHTIRQDTSETKEMLNKIRELVEEKYRIKMRKSH